MMKNGKDLKKKIVDKEEKNTIKMKEALIGEILKEWYLLELKWRKQEKRKTKGLK